MDKPKHSLLTGSFLVLQAQFTAQPAEVTENTRSSREAYCYCFPIYIYCHIRYTFLFIGQNLIQKSISFKNLLSLIRFNINFEL